jgi:hypothetical protein
MRPVGDPRAVHFDDVVHAYRWIFGREPETAGAIEKQVQAGRDVQGLRAVLLSSLEFRIRFLSSEIDDFWPSFQPGPLPETTTRVVFIHVPRSGGTSLHDILAEAVGPDRVCPARHNNLQLCLGGDLARSRLFSGHYDRNCLSLVPGGATKVVTMLRDPRRRLVSLYDFLRSHRPAAIEASGLELAAAARKYGLSDFLDAALDINPSAVDNTYLRAFGGRLPFRRWEQASEAYAPKSLADFGCTVAELHQRAAAFLGSMAAVGILEQFEDSARAIARALELEEPRAFPLLQSLRGITEDNEDFEPVRSSSISRAEEARISELTRFDMDLYELGKMHLAERLESHARKSPGPQESAAYGTKRWSDDRGGRVAVLSRRPSPRG